MKTLVLANQKGGVGKSAVATLLAHCLRQQGQRVLAIDLDHQANFSQPLRLSRRATLASFGADRLLTEPAAALPAAEFVLVPGDPRLLMLERQPDKHTLGSRRCSQGPTPGPSRSLGNHAPAEYASARLSALATSTQWQCV